MIDKCWLNIFLITVITSSCFVHSEKYRLCVVDGRGGFKRAARYCPMLDNHDSSVQCVIGVDRLDCLRKISKKAADFAVFTSEDLVTASNSAVELLITNELKFTEDKYEYEVVAVFNDDSGINNIHDLHDKRFCHPGYGYETEWTTILANYLEASVVPQKCDPQLTLTENRIKASSQYFKASCKSGPWVANTTLDKELKRKYKNLCELCDNPNKCSKQDKYWGRRGSLFCLTDGAGDISWSRLDDVRIHFGLVPGGKESPPTGYSFLCPDGTRRPVNGTKPCVWVVKPWSVIATERSKAQDVQELIASLSNKSEKRESLSPSWQSAVLSLIESYHLSIEPLEPIEPIEDYLSRATGFLSANSFSGCHPPRTIRICTTSIAENSKCSWLREAAASYGVEPDIDCLKADNTTHCMLAVHKNFADVVMIPPDLINKASSSYQLQTLFYETVDDDEKYITVAITRKDTVINNLAELRGLKACFPSHDGVAWNSVTAALRKHGLLDSCSSSKDLGSFFGKSCASGSPHSEPESFMENCIGFDGEQGAIRCLTEKIGDVAFISKNSLSKGTTVDQLSDKTNFSIFCEDKEQCHFSWAPIGQAMIRSNSTELWRRDTLDVFLQLDSIFGRNYMSLTTPFTMFGSFNGKSNLLFHDATIRLKAEPTARNFDTMEGEYDDILKTMSDCKGSSCTTTSSMFLVVLFIIICSNT